MRENEIYVLSSNPEIKETLRSMIINTLDAVLSSIDSDRCYSGIDPNDLRRIINSIEVLPESGIGFDKTLKRRSIITMPLPLVHSFNFILYSLRSEFQLDKINRLSRA